MPAVSFTNYQKSLFFSVLCSGLIGCGGTKVLDEAVPLPLGQPIAAYTNEHLAVVLDWVIVRDGPGTWARNADWDEYLIRFENRNPTAVSIRDVAVYDSTLTRQQSVGERKALVAASKQTARRYAGQGVEVKAGLGGGALMAAGVVGGTAAVGAGAAALYMSSAAAATTLGVLLAAPALIAGGVVKSVNQSRVNELIIQRQANLPLTLPSGETLGYHLFFPLVPAPRKLEVTYVVLDQQLEQVVELDLSAQLDGLHLKE